MIVQETIEGNDNLVKTYSDNGMMIRKIGTDELYSEAIDVFPCRYTYVETDKPLEDDGHETESYDF